MKVVGTSRELESTEANSDDDGDVTGTGVSGFDGNDDDDYDDDDQHNSASLIQYLYRSSISALTAVSLLTHSLVNVC